MPLSARGFTLFFAALVASLALAVGLAIYDLTVRELQLSGTASQSQYAIYAADTGAECALYWDSHYNGTDSAFATSSTSAVPSSGVACLTRDIAAAGTPTSPYTVGPSGWTAWSIVSSPTAATTTFTVPYQGARCSTVTVAKYTLGGPVRLYLTSGSSFTVPSDWNSANNTIEVIGGGGGGSKGNPGLVSMPGGGGGGGYSKVSNVSLTPGASVSYAVGAGGSGATAPGADGGAGGDTYFCNSSANCASISGTAVIVGAKGGSGGSTAATKPGGAAAGGAGSVKFSGGAGGVRSDPQGAFGAGGGGGAGGPNGSGGAGGFENTQPQAINTQPGTGGGGGGGGTNGGLPTDPTIGGNGGNNSSATGGGAGGNAAAGGPGSAGGGGGGAGAGIFGGGAGGAGTEWDSSHGSGGGGGGGASDQTTGAAGGAGGLYGGGGGGGAYGNSTSGNGGPGAGGIIVISYTGSGVGTSAIVHTVITAHGYNTCVTGTPNRLERVFQINY